MIETKERITKRDLKVKNPWKDWNNSCKTLWPRSTAQMIPNLLKDNLKLQNLLVETLRSINTYQPPPTQTYHEPPTSPLVQAQKSSLQHKDLLNLKCNGTGSSSHTLNHPNIVLGYNTPRVGIPDEATPAHGWDIAINIYSYMAQRPESGACFPVC